MGTVRNAASVALSAVRRGKQVAWTPKFMNLGNLLYVGLWAFREPTGRHARRVVLHSEKKPSMAMFPKLRDSLFMEPGEVSFFDQRLMPWKSNPDEDRERFVDPLLSSYINDRLLPGSPVTERPEDVTDDVLVVNVRRGDYFSVAEHQAEFGMDTVAYTLRAVDRAVADGGVPGRIMVASDDIAWCRSNLQGLAAIGPVEYRDGGPADDMAALVHAPRLILPNSTFSYWGGYIGDELYPGRQVVAPWLFARGMNGGRAHQLRPHWTRVDEIPGGWDVTA